MPTHQLKLTFSQSTTTKSNCFCILYDGSHQMLLVYHFHRYNSFLTDIHTRNTGKNKPQKCSLSITRGVFSINRIHVMLHIRLFIGKMGYNIFLYVQGLLLVLFYFCYHCYSISRIKPFLKAKGVPNKLAI